MNGEQFPDQSWRTPLRVGLERLANGLHEIFEREGRAYWNDPWAARDEYIIPDGAAKGMRGFFTRAADGSVDGVHVGGRLATRELVSPTA